MLDMDKKLHKRAIEASQKAYAPYSKKQVGCAILTESGEIFTGCNIENSSFGATICAERVAAFNAAAQGQLRFKRVCLYTEEGWFPCGMCRQVLREFGEISLPVVIYNAHGKVCETSLGELLPHSFGPEQMQS